MTGRFESGTLSMSIRTHVSSSPTGARSLIVFVANAVVVAEEFLDVRAHGGVVDARMPGEHPLELARGHAGPAPFPLDRLHHRCGKDVAGDHDCLATLDSVHHR